MRECYVPGRFNNKSEQTIEQANDIILDYRGQGYTLTLRQLYYQFVARDLIENSDKSYKRLGNLISKARLAGLVSWDAIIDNNRNASVPYVEERLEGAVEGIEGFYAPDLWANQDVYVEAWIEKDALSGVLERPCRRWNVPRLACKGYLSTSEMWSAANRFREQWENGKECVLLHLGDHDPSGVDMTRDNAYRLSSVFGVDVGVERLALNMDQVRRYNPPPNPAKVTDSRSTGYIERHGNKSWELDALEPKVIDQLVDNAIRELVDITKFRARQEEALEGRKVLEWIGRNSQGVIEFAREEMRFDDID